MRSLIFTLLFAFALKYGVSVSHGNDSAHIAEQSVRYAKCEAEGNWSECYGMLSELVREALSFKAFESRMNTFSFPQEFKRPTPAFRVRSVSHGIDLGRVLLRDDGARNRTLVASFTLIKEEGQWRILSISGLKSGPIIDELFFTRMLKREIEASQNAKPKEGATVR